MLQHVRVLGEDRDTVIGFGVVYYYTGLLPFPELVDLNGEPLAPGNYLMMVISDLMLFVCPGGVH